MVEVTVEWARLGKTKDDTAYQVLECSNGALTRSNFEDLLHRYSPGTLSLSDLPQVTISWLPGSAGQRYVALALHDRTRDHQVDISDAEIMMTNCFCVPFVEVAAGAVSYLTMFHYFNGISLPVSDRRPIRLDLPRGSAGLADVVGNGSENRRIRQAKTVAALLLTRKPVCVLDADGVAYNERLEFIDMVASFLPYGMRSELSAATWTNPTFRTHKIRLFFAPSDRGEADRLVTWNDMDQLDIGPGYAQEYLKLLRSGAIFPAMLSKEKKPVNFKIDSVASIVTELTKREPPAPPKPASARDRRASKEPTTTVRPQRPAKVGAAPARIVTASESTDQPRRQAKKAESPLAELIESVVIPLTSGNKGEFEHGIVKLEAHEHGERAWLKDLIEQKKLLWPNVSRVPFEESVIRRFYVVLLRLAFMSPEDHIGYQRYREVGQSAGYNYGEPPHPALARALMDVGVRGAARLLALREMDDDEVRGALDTHSIELASLPVMMAEPNIHKADVPYVYDSALRILRLAKRTSRTDRRAFVDAMYDRELVQAALDGFEESPADQLEVLTTILRFGYPGRMPRKAVKRLCLGIRSTPTDALLGALLHMVRQRDVPMVLREFAYGRIHAASFSELIRAGLERKVSHNVSRELSGSPWSQRAILLLHPPAWPPWLIYVAAIAVLIIVFGVFAAIFLHPL